MRLATEQLLELQPATRASIRSSARASKTRNVNLGNLSPVASAKGAERIAARKVASGRASLAPGGLSEKGSIEPGPVSDSEAEWLGRVTIAEQRRPNSHCQNEDDDAWTS